MISTEDILTLGFTLARESDNGRSFRSTDERFMLSMGEHEGFYVLMWFERFPTKTSYQRTDPEYYHTSPTGHRSKRHVEPHVHTVDEVIKYLVERKFQPAIVLVRNNKIKSLLE